MMKNTLMILFLFVGLFISNSVASREIVQYARWLDTSGNPINAHGGGILYHGGRYYWYGEYKNGPTYLPKGSWDGYRTDVIGVSCYSSPDMVDWTFEGIVLNAVSCDSSHDLHPSKVLERPKVVHNARTGKYVMWFHVDSDDYSMAAAGIAVSDSPTGPFKYLGALRPNNAMSRDQTLFVDEDGRAYQFASSEDNRTLYINELTDDYLRPTGRYTRNFIDKLREAPAVFRHGSKYYMLTSGCTGWNPNEAELAMADSIMGPWKIIGNPCTGPEADKTFYAQSTYVQPVYGKKDLYIAMFDRWNKTDLGDSRYVWLPISFDNGKVTIPWRKKWDIDEYEDIVSYPYEDVIDISGDGWQAVIDKRGGFLRAYTQGDTVPFRNDSLRGPAWEGVDMMPSDMDSLSFYGQKDGIMYTMKYIPYTDHLAIECGMVNATDTVFAPERASLVIGIDSEMHSFPQWNDRYFPTLLRCERDFAWGYFMSPLGRIVAVGVEEPVASYSLNYIYRDVKEWVWGHQIFTASWDMLHCGPLPARHPVDEDRLLPGEYKKWTMHIGSVDKIDEVKPALARWLSSPLIELDKYTVTNTEPNRMWVYSDQPLVSIVCTDGDGQSRKLKFKYDTSGVYKTTLPVFRKQGQYKIEAVNALGKQSEGIFYIRDDWSRYLCQARDMVSRHPPLMGNSCEMFYGYYPAFLASHHYPMLSDSILENRFAKAVSLLVDTVTGFPARCANPDRVQNFSSVMGILVDLYEATGREHYLTIASRVGDYLAGDKVQAADGSYRSHGIHYTAVIYPAKSMLELADAEKNRFVVTADSVWLSKAIRHRTSAMKAIDDLAERRDNIETEGDMTFEDGMISCSALQLALGALYSDHKSTREKYFNAAEYMLERHCCLEQNLIPDARMRGATLRYWEALDIYFTPNQAMNSPHGWTAWKIYAVYYMYLLTGNMKYMRELNDTLGACVQLMSPDGHLRWGFIPDPYINGRVCMPASGAKGNFEYTDSIIGEQYLDMISPWMRSDDEYRLHDFGETGGAGDHTVYEIFKALEETAISTAYIRIDDNNKITIVNCKVKLKSNKLQIETDRHIKRIHIQTNIPLKASLNNTHMRELSSGPNLIFVA